MPRRSSSRTNAQFWWANRSDVSLSGMVIHGASYGSQHNFNKSAANSSTAPSSVCSSQEEFSDGALHNLSNNSATVSSKEILRSSKTRGDLTDLCKEGDSAQDQDTASKKAKTREEWGQFVDVTISEEEELSAMQRGRFLVSPSRAKILRARRLLR